MPGVLGKRGHRRDKKKNAGKLTGTGDLFPAPEKIGDKHVAFWGEK